MDRSRGDTHTLSTPQRVDGKYDAKGSRYHSIHMTQHKKNVALHISSPFSNKPVFLRQTWSTFLNGAFRVCLL